MEEDKPEKEEERKRTRSRGESMIATPLHEDEPAREIVREA
jgi:hypothetical protein